MNTLTVRPESTALVVVDVQEKLITAMPDVDARRLIACAELLVETASLFRIPIFVTEQYPKGLGPTVASVRALVERAQPPSVVAEKTVFSSMAPAAVARGIAALRPQTVVVVGMEAHVCVFQTARELRARSISVHVPFDAVASRERACRETALRLLAAGGVSVTTTETIVFDLLQDSQHLHFRALSARVKALPPVG